MVAKILLLIGVLIFALLSVLFLTRNKYPKAHGPIVVLGDSIAAGVGTTADEAFPALIEKELGIKVINSGVSGNTTADALKRVDTDVLSHKPGIVIIELGGNDFLGRVDFEETKKNYALIVEKIKPTGAAIVVASINPIIDQRYEKYLEELAQINDAVFVSNILKGIISDPKLMVDRIHPNSEGHKKIAEKLIKVLKKLLD